MNREWTKLFKDSTLYDFDSNKNPVFYVKQHRDSDKMPPYSQWLQEKLDYFEDEKKGSHQNAIDLGARG